MSIMEQMRADAMCEAAGLLARRGYEHVHASELALALRMSVGSLYRRYGSKHGFALAVRDFAENSLCMRGRSGFECEFGREGVSFRQAFFSFWWELVAGALEEPGLFAFTFLHWHPHVLRPRTRYALEPYVPRSLGPFPSQVFDAYAPARSELDAREPRGSDAPGPDALESDASARSESDAREPHMPDVPGPDAPRLDVTDAPDLDELELSDSVVQMG